MTSRRCRDERLVQVVSAEHGAFIQADALGKAVAASEIGGVRLIVVDAIDDEAQSFYEHYHFITVRNRDRRLVMKVCTAAKALGQRWRA